MRNTIIENLDNCPTNSRNGTYGGKAGDKEGITYNGEPWIVKYPKSTRGMRGELASYTTAPLSEYIGSNAYQILGIEAHDTILGIRNGKLVVACKDFCQTEGSLREIRTLKNVYNKELAEKLEESLSSTSDSHLIDLESIMIHLHHNPILKEVPDISERFWEQVLVDVLINNNDRNSGNWGVLLENGKYRLAPVFDNGAAFSNKLPDYKLGELLQDSKRFTQSLENAKTIYGMEGQPVYAKDIQTLLNDDLLKTATRIIPVMAQKMREIQKFVDGIPEDAGVIKVCSQVRKEYYKTSLQARFEQFLLPVLENAERLGFAEKGTAEKAKQNLASGSSKA